MILATAARKVSTSFLLMPMLSLLSVNFDLGFDLDFVDLGFGFDLDFVDDFYVDAHVITSFGHLPIRGL